MNEATFDKMQYNELKEEIQTYAASGLGKQFISQMQPATMMTVVKRQLKETSEARMILDEEGSVPLAGISNVGRIMENLSKGFNLDPSDLYQMAEFLRGCRRFRQFILGKEQIAPELSAYAHRMSSFAEIEDRIYMSIQNNRVDSGASRTLRRLRNSIESLENKIRARLGSFLNNSSNQKYIQEFFVSNKDGRYTIPIKAAYKNQIAGSVVEVSSKKATVFIEPEAIAKLSQELSIAKTEETMEEYQILSELTELLYKQLEPLQLNTEWIGKYDMVFAKAKFSRAIGGMEPLLNEHGYIKLVNCRHPLHVKQAVPLHFEIGSNYRSLIITGPNAGGKTFVLKTIGLVTLATMSGIHIAAEEGTEISIFQQIFVDIGDNQSIENALSTFSSHIKNLTEIMNTSNEKTLLLFDEIGSGTEPNEGAALAIAILEEFYEMGCITVATTHYGEIKRFSEAQSGFMNAAMQFNQEMLEPLYKLVIGRSGDSNALWISRKMKMRERVLQRAQAYMVNKKTFPSDR